jgi:hypothetical protein
MAFSKHDRARYSERSLKPCSDEDRALTGGEEKR